jgi:hypothetical protein
MNVKGDGYSNTQTCSEDIQMQMLLPYVTAV